MEWGRGGGGGVGGIRGDGRQGEEGGGRQRAGGQMNVG